MSPALRLVLLTAAALALAGCGDTISGDAKTATAHSSSWTSGATSASPPTGNAVPAPHQTPNANTDGTTFDPCLAYSVAELNKWGLDPATVKGVDDGLQRGCIWDGKGWYVQQLVINRSISEYLDTDNYPDAQPLTIAGLQGSQHRLSQPGTGFCSVQIPSQRAVVATLVNVDAGAATRIPDACTKAIEIATDTAAKLPK
ncbi:hypothetical protein DE4585_04619 [Mycobacteroides salmoniphilum]|uniref:DUF3558 domain-containing protein n=1 Tax=Mycobacteroides salmoniphilum TaxID=404941 RepID=A0A4R8RWH7_9MYCO|nr:DUF3558 family protein [Mycobacteroides salmoniphilum]TDZ78782.1 hypothetical protein DE4585_04619 [Mycobacteroides salmoniphilum]